MAQQNFDHGFPDELQGFPGLRINAHGGSAFVAAQGAQLLSWQGSDGKERLYLSALSGGMRRGDSASDLGAPIRGGVPVCFPQFSGRGPMLKHGFARGMAWRHEEDGAAPCLSVTDNEQSRQHWQHAFHAQVTVTPGRDSLSVTLEVSNKDSVPWSFTGALHSYLRVDDIGQARLEGLQGARRWDAVRDLHLT